MSKFINKPEGANLFHWCLCPSDTGVSLGSELEHRDTHGHEKDETMSDNLFKTFADAVSTLDGAFGDIYNHPELQKKLHNVAQKPLFNVDAPVNIIKEEDGSWTFEVAIPGKTRENVKLSSVTDKGTTYLVFDVNAPEASDEEKAAQEKRKYLEQKIKGMTKLYFKYPVPADLDINKLTAKVRDGLLTVTVPVKEEVKPVEFEIG